MCRRVVCQSCRKATYEGCGNHVEEVLVDVPRHQRCTCDTAQRERLHPAEPAPRTGPAPDERWWARIIAWMKSPA